MRSLIISIVLLLILVVTPKHVFAEPLPGFSHIEVADVFYAPWFNDTGVFGAFGGYCGGDRGSQIIDWSIGNTVPHNSSMTDDIVFSTSVGHFMTPANWKERLRITKEGNVGIGTTNPTSRLQVEGNVDINSDLDVDNGTFHVNGSSDNVGIGTTEPAAPLVIKNDTSAHVLFQETGTGSTVTDGFFVGIEKESGFLWNYENKGLFFGTNNLTRMGILDNGDVGIGGNVSIGGNVGIGEPFPSVALDVIGDIEYTGTITKVSDERLKENIKPIIGALEKIQAINGVYYNMIDAPKQKEIGVVAQNVQDVLPEAVKVVDPENGYLGVSYTSLVPVIIEAVKELKAENDTVKHDNAVLKTENKQLREAFTVMADRQKSIENMLLVLSTNLPKEKMVKYNQAGLDEVEKIVQ